MSEPAINVVGLTKVFGDKTVVDNVSLRVEKGAVYGFLGSNGSGKTTTIRMICGLMSPTQGKGLCLGYDIRTQSADIKLKIGYMPQRFSLYGGLTVYENLQFFASIYHIKDPKPSIARVMNELGLTPYKNILAKGLSGGWKQSLSLASCLLHEPELLFLDEPTSGVDPKARRDFWNYLHKIAAHDGTTVLVTTHYMDEAEKCTNLAYINLGELLYTGKTSDLISFSKIKAYVVEGNSETLAKINDQIITKFPKLLVSVVNNELRISSRDEELLGKLLQSNPPYILKEVPPNFEEVFIGLMK